MFTSFFRPKVTLSYCLLTLFVATPVWADDIEIYSNGSGGGGSANIVFIIDTSTSMSADDGNDGKTRLKDVQDEFKNLLDKIVPMNTNSTGSINAAVMRFTNSSGGYFISPMQKIDAGNSASIKAKVDALDHNGFTPLTETLYEAALFFRGEKENYGAENNVAGVTNTVGGDNLYITPLTPTTQCSVSNHIVLLSDGEPSQDNEADEAIHNWVDPSNDFATNPICNSESGLPGDNESADSCLDELAGFLSANDQSGISGDQFVNTHTIAFGDSNSDFQLLVDTAAAGNGEYKKSVGASDLATAFEEILNSITMSTAPDSMAAPAFTVNTDNGLTHSEEVYFSLFQPAKSKAWNGNVKGFRIGTDPNDATRAILVDQNGNPAIVDGTISETARSLWSTVDDGADVTKGGAASKIPPVLRNVYTFADSPVPTNSGLVTISTLNGRLATNTNNRLVETNTAITPNMLFPPNGTIPTGVTTAGLIKWGRGVNDDNSPRLAMGDPLHSQPVVVTYSSSLNVLYVATNEGYLHAIDTSDGAEIFAFMPQALLKNLDKLKNNTGNEIHPYGLDGSITTWVKDVNGDGDIVEASGDRVYLYVGMRRGGNKYFMLDVTNPDTPILNWIIQGGIAGTDYAELGQTWSRPTLGKLKIGGADKQVLVFGGGYDPQEDLDPAPANNSIGRAIFIVDALTGQRLWSAGPSGATVNLATMTNSIPSDVRVLDVNLDGYIDRLYVGDMGAQIFRVDINNGADSTATSVDASIGLLADLGGTGASDRRFYNAPDIVLTKNPNLPSAYLSINIGSGYRAHPLNTDVTDHFYSIRDVDVFEKPATYPNAISLSDLYDTTANLIGQATGQTQTDAKDALYGSTNKGWYVIMEGSGEKVLAEAMTYDNQVFFSTYSPQAAPANSCTSLPGLGKLYAVSLFDATPVRNHDNAIALTKEDRLVKDLDKGGIPSPPAVVFAPGKKPTLMVGNEPMGLGLELSIEKTYWTPK